MHGSDSTPDPAVPRVLHDCNKKFQLHPLSLTAVLQENQRGGTCLGKGRLTNQPRSMTLQGIDKRFGTESKLKGPTCRCIAFALQVRAERDARFSTVSGARGVLLRFPYSLLVCSPLPYCICELLRSVHDGSGYLFPGNGLRLLPR